MDIIGQFNGGATCWLNATYQALCALRPFMVEIHTIAAGIDANTLALSAAVTAQLSNKFFGPRLCDIPECARGEYISEAFAGADQAARVTFARIVTVARELGDPRTFYECARLADLARNPGARPLPLAICAFAGYGAPCDPTLREHFLAGSALRLFCALVVYCATTGARPTPEYGTIGEVGPAMLETIIGALEHEGARNIRALFQVGAHARTLCARCIARLPASDMRALAHHSAQLAHQLCIHVVPPSIANLATYADARDIFVAQVQVSVDVAERACGACATPGVASIEMREEFAPCIAIATDDMIARGLTRNATSTATYRRNPLGNICVPQIITLMRRAPDGSGDFALATYQLASQIIQEGGHFVAQVTHWNGQIAYISDSSVRAIDAMTISPGMCTLFYVRRTTSAIGAPREITISRTRAESIANLAITCAMHGFAELNANSAAMVSSGYAPQPAMSPASIVSLYDPPGTITHVAARFYDAAIKIGALLSAKLVIPDAISARLYARGVGAQFATAIARALIARNGDERAFDYWNLWIDPAVLAIIGTDECDKIRAVIVSLMGNAADDSALTARAEYVAMRAGTRDILRIALQKISASGTSGAAIMRTAPIVSTVPHIADVAIFPRRASAAIRAHA